MKTSMFKTSLAALAAIALAAPIASSAQAPSTNAPVVQKIGTIDLRRTFDGYYKTKQADAGLKTEAAEIDAQRKDMVDSLRKGEDEFKKFNEQANDQAISASEREKAKKQAERKFAELKDSENAIKQFLQNNQEKLKEKQRRLREKILGEIQDLVNAKAKAAGYIMVLDTASETINNTKVVVYTTGENDLTDGILAQLNASAPADFKPDAPDAGAAKPLVPDLGK
jgi:outer membrane protein